MARVYTCGFELGNTYLTTGPYEFTGRDGAGGLGKFEIRSGNLSSDGYSKCNYNSNYGLVVGYDSGTSASRMYVNMYDTPTTMNHYFGFDFMANAAGSGTVAVIWSQPTSSSIFTVYPFSGTSGELTAGATGSTFSVMLRPVDNLVGAYYNYQLDLRDSTGATVATGSSVLFHNTFYRIELGFTYNTGGTTGTVSMYINDVVEFDSVVVTSTGKDKVCSFSAGPENPAAGTNFKSAQCVFDNIRVNNSYGSLNNSYPGEGYIIHCLPTGGNTSDWVNSAGNNNNNYSYVDDGAAQNDPTTDYVQRTTTGPGTDSATTIGSVTINGKTELYNPATPWAVFPTNGPDGYQGIPNPTDINLAIVNVGIGTVNGSASNTNSSTRGCVSFLAQGNATTRAYSLDSSKNDAYGYTDQSNSANYGQDWSINGYGANYDDANTSKVGNRPGLLNFVTPAFFTNMANFADAVNLAGFGVRAFANNGNTIRLAYIWLMVEYTYDVYDTSAQASSRKPSTVKFTTTAKNHLTGSGL